MVHGGEGEYGYEGEFRFTKFYDGEEGWWDRRGYRRGLEAFIGMAEEEWDAEMNRFITEDEAAEAEATEDEAGEAEAAEAAPGDN